MKTDGIWRESNTRKTSASPQPIRSANLVGFFLNLGARVDAAVYDKDGHDSFNGYQPLHFAAGREDMGEAIKVAVHLLKAGADVNATNADGDTPLHLSKDAAMTRLLLAHGAKPDAMSSGTSKSQPIHRFALRGDRESIKILLEHGVEIDAANGDGDTALDQAAYTGRTETVKFLLEQGAGPTEQTMRKACYFRDSPIEILQMLHAHWGTVSADLFLHHHPESCAILIPFLSAETRGQLLDNSARHIAEAAGSRYHRGPDGSLGTIRALVELGARTDQPWDGLLPIHHAVLSGKEAVVDYLLAAGQPVDTKGTCRDDDEEPPLVITECQPIHLAVWSPELIPFLIGRGAKINALTGEGWQPIHLAAAFGDKAAFDAIIRAGGDPKAKTRDGKPPLRLAVDFNNQTMIEHLIERRD